jgi:predicted acetyltransferase
MSACASSQVASPRVGGTMGYVSGVASLRLVTGEDRLVLDRLWQLYAHDLSEFRGSMPDGEGRYQLGRLPTYLDDPDRAAYLFCQGSAPMGFALIRGLSGEPRVIGEFFVVRAARRHGVGHRAALELLGRYPGRWEIAFQEENSAAARFWRAVATAAVGDAWTEELRPIPNKPEATPDVWLLLGT